MATFADLRKEMEELLAADGPSLAGIEEVAGHTSSDAMEPVSITIEWLNERIVALEALNAVVRNSQAGQEDS